MKAENNIAIITIRELKLILLVLSFLYSELSGFLKIGLLSNCSPFVETKYLFFAR